MNRWDKASYFAFCVIEFILKYTFYICGACFILLLPSVGVAIWMDGMPIVGIPLTILFSLITICFVVIFVCEKVGDWKARR